MEKRLFYSLAVWLLCICSVTADNIVINDISVPQGGIISLPIGYNFTSTSDKVGFTFCLELPSGLSIAEDSDGDPIFVKDASISKFNIVYTEGNFAGQPSNATTTISGTSGTLLTLQLKADNSLNAGNVYVVNVTKCTFQQRIDDAVTDINLPDFTFNVTIEGNDGRIHFDESSTSLPTYTAGEKGDVTMKRTIKAGVWSTIVLPFTLNKAKAEEIFGNDVQLAEYTGFEVDYGDDDANDVPLSIKINVASFTMTPKKGMTGGKPFLIKTSKNIESFQADEVTLFDAVTDVIQRDENDTPGKFTGSLVKSVIPEDGLFLSDNTFWYSSGKTNIKAFRCWFEFGAVLDKNTNFDARMELNFVDSTPIHSLLVGGDDDSWYTLNGMKLNKKPTVEGIYIHHGEKIIIKGNGRK